MSKQKVFCIGFHKTGTKSLAAALRQLGYQVTGPNGTQDPDIAKNVYELAFNLLDQFDAFQDNPWPVLFDYLDKTCPNSKFILSLRETGSWIESQVKYFGGQQTPMRQWIYGAGCPLGNEAAYVARYEQHNRDVLDYFAGRHDDLLVMELAKGQGWQELCPFLGKTPVSIPFPHENKA